MAVRLSALRTRHTLLPRNIIIRLGLLHRVDVGEVAGTSKINAASIFRVEMCRLVSLSELLGYWTLSIVRYSKS
jgi:hypothetical protein